MKSASQLAWCIVVVRRSVCDSRARSSRFRPIAVSLKRLPLASSDMLGPVRSETHGNVRQGVDHQVRRKNSGCFRKQKPMAVAARVASTRSADSLTESTHQAVTLAGRHRRSACQDISGGGLGRCAVGRLLRSQKRRSGRIISPVTPGILALARRQRAHRHPPASQAAWPARVSGRRSVRPNPFMSVNSPSDGDLAAALETLCLPSPEIMGPRMIDVLSSVSSDITLVSTIVMAN